MYPLENEDFANGEGGTPSHPTNAKRPRLLRVRPALSRVEGCLRGEYGSATATRTTTRHASVAAPIPGHDGSADRAAWRVAHIDQLFQGVGSVMMSGRRFSGTALGWVSHNVGINESLQRLLLRTAERHLIRSTHRSDTADVLRTQTFEERLLLSGEEAKLQPAEDVIHDRLGVADVGIAAPAAGLEAGMRELLAEQFERHAMLQTDGDGAGEAVHEATDGGAFLGHGDEDLARHTVFVEAHGEIALVSSDAELVRD